MMIYGNGQHKRPRQSNRRRNHMGAKPVLAVVLIAAAVIAVELLVSAIVGPSGSTGSEQNQYNEELQSQEADTEQNDSNDDATEDNAQATSVEQPDASEDVEREAIASWLVGRGIASDASDGVRIKSVAGKATTQDADGNDVEIPIVTSYWRVNGSYVVVTDRQGQHYVAPLTETVEGVNDAASNDSANGSVATSNSETGAAIPDSCMSTLYERLSDWAKESGTDIVAAEAYVDDSTITVNDTNVAFDMRGPNTSRQPVVVHVLYDTTTDSTTFNN